MVTRLNTEMWKELEMVLIKYGAGYKVEIDNHLGKPELNIHLDTIKVFMPEVNAR